MSGPSLLARLLGNKSQDDEDEGSAPAVQDKAAPAAHRRRQHDLPVQRTKPAAATLQVAAADAQTVQAAKPKQPAVSDNSSEAKPQTPADIINARGFWDNMPAAPMQATKCWQQFIMNIFVLYATKDKKKISN